MAHCNDVECGHIDVGHVSPPQLRPFLKAVARPRHVRPVPEGILDCPHRMRAVQAGSGEGLAHPSHPFPTHLSSPDGVVLLEEVPAPETTLCPNSAA